MSADRYRLPDPKCNHVRRGLVSSGDPRGAYASTQVCSRPECIDDAMAWSEATTGLTATHRPDRVAEPVTGQLALFGGAR